LPWSFVLSAFESTQGAQTDMPKKLVAKMITKKTKIEFKTKTKQYILQTAVTWCLSKIPQG
jgi:hypothetical protein